MSERSLANSPGSVLFWSPGFKNPLITSFVRRDAWTRQSWSCPLLGDDLILRDREIPYAYAVEDYLFWLGEGLAVTRGLFGENLTVRGLELHDAAVGER